MTVQPGLGPGKLGRGGLPPAPNSWRRSSAKSANCESAAGSTHFAQRILPSKTSRIEPLNRGRDALPRVQADRQVGPTHVRGEPRPPTLDPHRGHEPFYWERRHPAGEFLDSQPNHSPARCRRSQGRPAGRLPYLAVHGKERVIAEFLTRCSPTIRDRLRRYLECVLPTPLRKDRFNSL